MAVGMNKLVNLDRLKEFQTSENAATASEFSTSKSYAAGAYVYYKGKLYKFKSAHAAGAWTTTDVEEAKLADDVSSLKESITEYNAINLLPVSILSNDAANGITFTKQSNGTYCSGTASKLAYTYITYSITNMAGFEVGKSYYVAYDRVDTNIYINFQWYDSNGDYTQTRMISEGWVTVPQGTVGVRIRLQVSSGATVDSLIRAFAFPSYTNAKLTEIAQNGANVVAVSGSTPTITAESGTRYVCGEVTTLNFTPSASGVCDVIFTSGSTATELTVPNTVLFPEWFTPASLEANTTYEINIMDGVYGAVASWG